MFLCQSRWLSAGVLAAAVLLAAPSVSHAGISVLVEEVDAGGNVVSGGGQPAFTSPNLTGTFTVNALPTPSFSSISVTVNRSTGLASDLNTITTTVNIRPSTVLTGDHFLRVIVDDDGFLNSHPNGLGTLTDDAGTSAGIIGGTNTAEVVTQLTTGTLPGPLSNLGNATAGSSNSTPGGSKINSPAVSIPSVPGAFGVEQSILIIAHADPTTEGIAINSTLGGTLSSVITVPTSVPAPAGVALVLVGLPILGLRRVLRKKPAAATA
jgi:hypothetical protein